MTTTPRTITSLLRENKTVLIVIGVILFLIELEIFAVAAMKSGRKSWLQIIDRNGNVIHETDGKNLSDFNKYYFEKNFGPLDQYEKRLEVREKPFPFRAWVTAAVGIPIGVVLLFAFVVKAYVSLLYGDEPLRTTDARGQKVEYSSEFEKIVKTVNSFNIFTIGFLILLAVFMYWVLPNMVAFIGRVGVDTLIRFKWVFIATGVVMVGLIAWIVYLRYLLAKRNIDKQADLERERLQLEYKRESQTPLQLEYDPDEEKEPPLVAWQEETPEAEEEEVVDAALKTEEG